MDTTTWHFRPLRELWEQLLPRIRSEAVEGLGFLGIHIPATVLFLDAGGFTELSNEYVHRPGVAAFIATHFARLVENWTVGSIGAFTRNVYLDKIVGDAVLLVIPGSGERDVALALLVAAAAVRGDRMYSPRVGVHAGEVMLADVGIPSSVRRRESFEQVTVMGPVVNLSQRLSGHAPTQGAALLGEPITALGIEPIATPLVLPGLDDAPNSGERVRLKGFGEQPYRIRRMMLSSQAPGAGVDRREMLDRVATMTEHLPRTHDASRVAPI